MDNMYHPMMSETFTCRMSCTIFIYNLCGYVQILHDNKYVFQYWHGWLTFCRLVTPIVAWSVDLSHVNSHRAPYKLQYCNPSAILQVQFTLHNMHQYSNE